MQIKFIGDPRGGDTSESIVAYGLTFPRGEPVDVSGLEEWQQIKLSRNTHYEVTAKKRGRKRKVVEDVEALSDAELEVLTAPEGQD